MVVLIDGMNLAYQAYLSHTAMRTKDGEPTGLLFGFLMDLLRIGRAAAGCPMVICWDGSKPTWRHIANPGYKANRKPNPNKDKIDQQLPALMDVLKTLGFQIPRIDGVEADDLIGILSTSFTSAEDKVRIYSNDRDMYQLAGPKVEIWNSHKKKPMTLQAIESVFQVKPQYIPEIRAMTGDQSDNLKGLYNIGPKKALHLWKTGFRPSNPKCVMAMRSQHAREWARVHQEYKLGKIVTSCKDEVWTAVQKERLELAVTGVLLEPGRIPSYSENMRMEFYDFIGRWELGDLVQIRTQFFSLP